MPFPDFEKGVPPDAPLSARAAADRGHQVVNGPVFGLMILCLLATMLAVYLERFILSLVFFLCMFVLPHLWWSWAAPRWRHWALSRGADPDELQGIAQREKLLWPQGHWCERLEIPVRKQLPRK